MESLHVALYNIEFYNASLLVSEYMYKKHKSFFSMKYIVMNLCKLKCYDKILEIITNDDKLLNDYTIRLIFYKCVDMTMPDTNTNKHANLLKNEYPYKNEDVSKPVTKIDTKSIEMYWKALTKRDIIRKQYLVNAYNLDTRNLESLYALLEEELVSENELRRLIEQSEYRDVYKDIFNDVYVDEYYHPYYIFIYTKYLYTQKDVSTLFTLSHNAYKVYESSVYSYLSLSLYFILLKNFKEGKRFLLKALSLDKNNGHVYLYLGICYSTLRECENSLSCLSICNKRMMCTWKSYYYLAREYQMMTNYEKARFYYKEGIGLDRNVKIQKGFIILLIFCEDYKEALSYLSSILSTRKLIEDMDSLYLLKCYCYLFLGNVSECRRYLDKCNKDYRYYCTAGYIEHIVNDLEKACELYNKSILLKHSTVVENLMSKSFEKDRENDVYNSCTEIFEYVFIDNTNIDVV